MATMDSSTRGIPEIPLLVDDNGAPLCVLCLRIISRNEETFGLCENCKVFLLEDLGSPSYHNGFGRLRRTRRSTAVTGFCSFENMFTAATIADDDNGGSRGLRILSDTDSLGAFYNSDSSMSLYGDNESIQGESSDAILEGEESHDLSFLETDMSFIRSPNRSQPDSDTDDDIGSIYWTWDGIGRELAHLQLLFSRFRK